MDPRADSKKDCATTSSVCSTRRSSTIVSRSTPRTTEVVSEGYCREAFTIAPDGGMRRSISAAQRDRRLGARLDEQYVMR